MITVIVKFPLRKRVTRQEMAEKFKASSNHFVGMPGLVRKYFCYDEENCTGHSIYVWERKEDAEAFFNQKFLENFQKKFGVVPEYFMVDTLLVVDNEGGKVNVLPN